MSCITEINKRTLERIREAVDWLSQPVRILIDEGEIHVALSVSVGEPAHYGEHHTSEPDSVVEFVEALVPHYAEFMSITFKEQNVVDEIAIASRDDCLVIHNTMGAPSINICTLLEVLEIDKNTTSRTFRRIARGEERQICLTRPREEWMLSQNRANAR